MIIESRRETAPRAVAAPSIALDHLLPLAKQVFFDFYSSTAPGVLIISQKKNKQIKKKVRSVVKRESVPEIYGVYENLSSVFQAPGISGVN